MEFTEKKILKTSFIEPHDAICKCKFCKQLMTSNRNALRQTYEKPKTPRLLNSNDIKIEDQTPQARQLTGKLQYIQKGRIIKTQTNDQSSTVINDSSMILKSEPSLTNRDKREVRQLDLNTESVIEKRFQTSEEIEQKREERIKQMQKTRPYQNFIDSKPYVRMAKRMKSFHGQILKEISPDYDLIKKDEQIEKQQRERSNEVFKLLNPNCKFELSDLLRTKSQSKYEREYWHLLGNLKKHQTRYLNQMRNDIPKRPPMLFDKKQASSQLSNITRQSPQTNTRVKNLFLRELQHKDRKVENKLNFTIESIEPRAQTHRPLKNIDLDSTQQSYPI